MILDTLVDNTEPSEMLSGLLAVSGIAHLLEVNNNILMSLFYLASTCWVLLQIYFKLRYPRSK